jgi:magnesium chelatase subunit I
MSSFRPPFPFSAIVGQEQVIRCLLATAVDPLIGGLLIFGNRGTGKSTAVRALSRLLPPMKVVADCVYHCDPEGTSLCEACRKKADRLKATTASVPVVDLPLGASEDRVVGALDLESALTRGEKVLETGLLAKANRGYLYIDEVNLLEDHIVDLLLDVAASGENVIEREGLSVRHPARFVLDWQWKSGRGRVAPATAGPVRTFCRRDNAWRPGCPGGNRQAARSLRARCGGLFDRVAWQGHGAAPQGATRPQDFRPDGNPDEILELVSRLCMTLGTDGLRGELTLARTARAFAALDGKKVVTARHVLEAAIPALRHRLRRDPLDDTGSDVRIERAIEEVMAA